MNKSQTMSSQIGSQLKTLFRKVWNIHLVRFGMVAGLNTLFGYSLYALLLTVGLHYVWATLIGQVPGDSGNFKGAYRGHRHIRYYI